MTEIHVKSIPAAQHRYRTLGDYYYDRDNVLQVRVTEMGNETYEKLVIIHELIEELMTKHKGIKEEDILAFDQYFEMRRDQGLVPDDLEPGFSNEAPYLKDHTIATAVEMMICGALGISWIDYGNFINTL